MIRCDFGKQNLEKLIWTSLQLPMTQRLLNRVFLIVLDRVVLIVTDLTDLQGLQNMFPNRKQPKNKNKLTKN